jgi:hypothetical protein
MHVDSFPNKRELRGVRGDGFHYHHGEWNFMRSLGYRRLSLDRYHGWRHWNWQRHAELHGGREFHFESSQWNHYYWRATVLRC